MKWFKCRKCGEEKPQTNFYRDKHKPSGFKPRCKPCDLLSRDKAARAEYEKKYWDSRREERRKMVRESHERNKDHHKKKRREYLRTESGKAKCRKHSQTRYAREKDAFVEHVDPMSVYRDQDGVCYLCKSRFSFDELELDHVFPLAAGGKHQRSNVAMACIRCNRSKGAKILEVDYQVV